MNTLYSTFFPSLQHFGHSQLFGKSSLTIPSESAHCNKIDEKKIDQINKMMRISLKTTIAAIENQLSQYYYSFLILEKKLE